LTCGRSPSSVVKKGEELQTEIKDLKSCVDATALLRSLISANLIAKKSNTRVFETYKKIRKALDDENATQ
jgi:hypothetical protein